MNRRTFEWHTEADCLSTARYLQENLVGGMTVGLVGDLGAGKTTFMKYMLQTLGSTDEVSSPTFVLGHLYAAPAFQVEHWDLYRLTETMPDELWEPPMKNMVRFIEWPDKSSEVLSTLDCLIDISFAIKDNQRTVIVSFQ